MHRLRVAWLGMVVLVLLSACDWWPREYHALAKAVGQKVSGETTALLLGGDVMVISVTDSPLVEAERTGLEAIARELADLALQSANTSLESIVITMHGQDADSGTEHEHDFVFLVENDQPALQPHFDLEATGPLTVEEIRSQFIDRLDDTLSDEQKSCMLHEAEQRARQAGDPETLDPTTVEFLPTGPWQDLDSFGRRLILGQAIVTRALFDCS